jgi:hypothetical protein
LDRLAHIVDFAFATLFFFLELVGSGSVEVRLRRNYLGSALMQ